ncbi:MAG TPA: ATP-binding protein [Burkholderiaceae bacterium]|nr:ATP-binding protein [Burkholderiaceae bacterium]
MKSASEEGLAQAQATDAALRVPAQSGSTAAIRLDPQGRIRDATVSAAAILGFEPQELRGRSLKDLAIEGWQAAAEVAAARVRFGATETFELALKGRSGRRTLVEMTARTGADDKAGTLVAWSERRIRRSASSPDADRDPGRMAYAMLRTQEAERMRVAGQLHDDVAPVVVMVKYMIEDALARMGPGAASESVEILQDAALRLRDVISQLRRISTDLRPKLLDDLGLLATLQWYCRSIEQACKGLQVACQLQVGEADIEQRLKLDIFRIVQEALNNVIEHALARRVQVHLYRTVEEFCLMIEDDGRGFDPTSGAMKDEAAAVGLGLQSIRRRVEATGGRMVLDTAPGRGTRIGACWRLALTHDR